MWYKLKLYWDYVWGKKFTIAPWILIPAIVVGGVLIIWFLAWPEFDAKHKYNIDRITLTVGVIGASFLGIVGLLNLIANYRRTITLEEQLKDQRENDKRRDQQQLYATNIVNLGNDSESVRLGAIYGLERFARESEAGSLGNNVSPNKCELWVLQVVEKLCPQNSNKATTKYEPWAPKVAEILCAHIRITTTKDNYLENNQNKPSSEIAATLKLLTQGENNPFASAQLDLSGASLKMANLRRANLSKFNLRQTDLSESDLVGSNLIESDLRESNFWKTYLTGGDLSHADLRNANLARADLIIANLTRANLRRADLRGAYLFKADLVEANLSRADLYGTNLTDVDLTGANLRGAIRLAPRRNAWANFSKCKIGHIAADFRDIYWGVYTQGLSEARKRDLIVGGRGNQDRYLAQNTVRRQPTQEEKEYLVGKENVDKCIWGDIHVLEDKD